MIGRKGRKERKERKGERGPYSQPTENLNKVET
jgi:hypothetical protein